MFTYYTLKDPLQINQCLHIDDVPLTGREIDELYPLMAEPLDLLELLTTPQSDASLVEGGQIGAFRRPPHICLGPALQQTHSTATEYKSHRRTGHTVYIFSRKEGKYCSNSLLFPPPRWAPWHH